MDKSIKNHSKYLILYINNLNKELLTLMSTHTDFRYDNQYSANQGRPSLQQPKVFFLSS